MENKFVIDVDSIIKERLDLVTPKVYYSYKEIYYYERFRENLEKYKGIFCSNYADSMTRALIKEYSEGINRVMVGSKTRNEALCLEDSEDHYFLVNNQGTFGYRKSVSLVGLFAFADPYMITSKGMDLFKCKRVRYRLYNREDEKALIEYYFTDGNQEELFLERFIDLGDTNNGTHYKVVHFFPGSYDFVKSNAFEGSELLTGEQLDETKITIEDDIKKIIDDSFTGSGLELKLGK